MIPACLVFTACDDGENNQKHEHTYAKEWTNDETHHWHAATCEHTESVSDMAPHDFKNGACSVCGLQELLNYSLNDEGSSYSVVGVKIGDGVSVRIPATYEGKPVTGIGYGAFSGRAELTTVIFDEDSNIESIGDTTFNDCTALESITIPKSVTSIGSNAFHNCTALSAVTISEDSKLESIGENAFGLCEKITSITIPKSVKRLGMGAFSNCNISDVYINDISKWCKIEFDENISSPLFNGGRLHLNGTLVTELTIPDDVATISDYAFYNCTSLKSITIPRSVTSIASTAFGYCVNLENITVDPENGAYLGAGNCLIEKKTKTLITGCKNSVIPDDKSVEIIGNASFGGCIGLKSVAIPSSVTHIENGAFVGCTSLADVTFAENSQLGDVGVAAFADCHALKSITIPSSVYNLLGAFNNCSGVERIDVDSGNESFKSVGNCLLSKNVGEDSYTLIQGCKNSVIPSGENVIEIDDSAFAGITELKSVVIPSSVKEIGWYVFCDCTGLTSVEISDSVTDIGDMVFRNCTALAEIKYTGTKAQWNDITKKPDWAEGIPSTCKIKCSDGELSIK